MALGKGTSRNFNIRGAQNRVNEILGKDLSRMLSRLAHWNWTTARLFAPNSRRWFKIPFRERKIRNIDWARNCGAIDSADQVKDARPRAEVNAQ